MEVVLHAEPHLEQRARARLHQQRVGEARAVHAREHAGARQREDVVGVEGQVAELEGLSRGMRGGC